MGPKIVEIKVAALHVTLHWLNNNNSIINGAEVNVYKKTMQLKLMQIFEIHIDFLKH